MDSFPLFIAVIAAGYVLGSVPTGQIVGALHGGVDLSQHGSGKTGATNALRTLGPGAGAAVLLGDLAKGGVAFLLAHLLFPSGATQQWAEALAGFSAVIGHNWSLFIHFKGGRGVAVSFAVFLLLCWPAALLTALTFAVVVGLSRIVSLASIVGAVVGLLLLAAFVVWVHYPAPFLAYGVLAAVLVLLRHLDNMQRILAGNERRLGQKAGV